MQNTWSQLIPGVIIYVFLKNLKKKKKNYFKSNFVFITFYAARSSVKRFNAKVKYEISNPIILAINSEYSSSQRFENSLTCLKPLLVSIFLILYAHNTINYL